MNDDRIRERVRAPLSTGAIPRDEAEATRAGNGFGKRCSACGEPVRPEEIEDECGAMPR
jgi:hypothetical protein